MQVLFLLALITFATAQTYGWQATFAMTTTTNMSGISTGTVTWRWSPNDDISANTRYYFQLLFDVPGSKSNHSTELYQYNSDGGYGGNVFGQNRFLDSGLCSPTCATSGISSSTPAMPPMWPALGSTYFNGPSGSTDCKTYTPKTASVVTSWTANPNTGAICSFIMDDGCTARTFTLTGWKVATPTIQPPSGCSCTSVLDIMIVVDHSGSITDVESFQLHGFVVSFLKQLTISENSVHVGIVWFAGGAGPQTVGGMQSDPSQIATSISNCSTNKSPPYAIGDCATQADRGVYNYVWPTPCGSSKIGQCTDQWTTTSSGVLLGGAIMFAKDQKRKVPKLFITLTDGAVNKQISTSDAKTWWTDITKGPKYVSTCSILPGNSNNDGSNCTTQLKQVVNNVKAQHADWMQSVGGCAPGQCDLTFIAVGVGIELYSFCDPSNPQTADGWIKSACHPKNTINPWKSSGDKTLVCYDDGLCLTSQTLDVLAAGAGVWGATNNNILYSDNWVKLNNEFIPKLLALSCPDTPYTMCACSKVCTGYCAGTCSGGVCVPPVSCAPVNNKCYTISSTPSPDGKCPPVPVTSPCPESSCNCSYCVKYTCNPNGANGAGSCDPVYTPAGPCPNQPSGCAQMLCNATSGSCYRDISKCPDCNFTIDNTPCTGAVPCGTNGSQGYTRTDTGDCQHAGETETRPCCVPCDCKLTDWVSDGADCTDCTHGAYVLHKNRSVIPAQCGGDSSCDQAPLTDEIDCASCEPVDCEYQWQPWICDCETQTTTRNPIIFKDPRNNGTACPDPEEESCTCCESKWNQTDCSCDTNTYSRTWYRTVQATGNGSKDCEPPIPSDYPNLPCSTPPECAICSSADDCDDGNLCTQDICDTYNETSGLTTKAKHCRNPPYECPSEPSVCYNVTCDSNLGCLRTPSIYSYCDDNDVCTDDVCDDVKGCQHSYSALYYNCSNAPGLTDCNYPICNPFTGCDVGHIQCNSTGNCSVSGCDPDWNSTDPDVVKLCNCEDPTGPCYSYNVCASDIGLAIGLAAGSVAAVVVCCAFAGFLIVSGGTYALASQARSVEDNHMSNNPFYKDKGLSGQSPFHEG